MPSAATASKAPGTPFRLCRSILRRCPNAAAVSRSRSRTSTPAGASIGKMWTTADITVSTVADQTPIAPGRRVSDSVANGRRTARFVSDAPMAGRYIIGSQLITPENAERYYFPDSPF